MPDHWDFVMKQLLREKPQHFVSWVLQDAVFDSELSLDLKRETIYADGLYRVLLYDQPMVLHLEFQSTRHTVMAERLLEYNTLASREHEYLPVYSCVFYLFESEKVPQPPFIRRLPDGTEVVRFNYRSIELYNMSAQSILQRNQVSLLPLVLFTSDGKQPGVLDEVVERLDAAQNKEVSTLAYVLAGLIFQDDADQETLKRRFAMLEEIIEQSWTYQRIKKMAQKEGELFGFQRGIFQGIEQGLRQGIEQGLQQGIEQGLQEGRQEGIEQGIEQGLQQGRIAGSEAMRQELLQAQREALFSEVQKRFPELMAAITTQANRIEDPLILQNLMLKIVTAQSSKEVRQLLAEWG